MTAQHRKQQAEAARLDIATSPNLKETGRDVRRDSGPRAVVGRVTAR